MYIPKVVWTIPAREDIQAIKRQHVLGRDGKQGIEALKATLASRVSLIQQFPLIGMANPDRPKIRKFLLNDYYDIVYEPREEVIVIHGIVPNWLGQWPRV